MYYLRRLKWWWEAFLERTAEHFTVTNVLETNKFSTGPGVDRSLLANVLRLLHTKSCWAKRSIIVSLVGPFDGRVLTKAGWAAQIVVKETSTHWGVSLLSQWILWSLSIDHYVGAAYFLILIKKESGCSRADVVDIGWVNVASLRRLLSVNSIMTSLIFQCNDSTPLLVLFSVL